MNVEQLTGDFGQTVPMSPGTSGIGQNNTFDSKDLTVAKYNKNVSNDEIMRISSTYVFFLTFSRFLFSFLIFIVVNIDAIIHQGIYCHYNDRNYLFS